MKTRMHECLARAAVAVVLACGMGLSVASAEASLGSALSITIPPGDLKAALKSLAKQTGVQLLYDRKTVEGLKTSGVTAARSAQEAVTGLLQGTSLVAAVDASGAVLIRRADQSSDIGLQMVEPVRMAMGEDKEKGEQDKDAQQVVVQGERERIKPFANGNMDAIRTINDVQPYYIFDSQQIEQSGIANMEDFLKQRLPMNTVAAAYSQRGPGGQGNISQVNLRGLGTDKTLILVNGRRAQGINLNGDDYQPDLNGIPLSAVERIEVLPSAGSGIYGGSAIGGVINVILKRNYSGSELRAVYDNTMDSDAPSRTMSATFGGTIGDGRMRYLLTAQNVVTKPLLYQDRIDLFNRAIGTIRANYPNALSSNSVPFLGSTPNITRFPPIGTLVLDGDVALSSRITSIPKGTSPAISVTDLRAALIANSGSYNLEFPDSTQDKTGLRKPFAPQTRVDSVSGFLGRQMTDRLELFLDAAISRNRSDTTRNPIGVGLTLVQAAVPSNPFASTVSVSLPNTLRPAFTTDSRNFSATLGVIASLPSEWTAETDYTATLNKHSYTYFDMDRTAFNAAMMSGSFNPFVDLLMYDQDIGRFLYSSEFRGETRGADVAARASGPLPFDRRSLLTTGLQFRTSSRPDSRYDIRLPLTPSEDAISIYYSQKQSVYSGYAEALIPLLPERQKFNPLEMQLAVRSERYEVDAGTPSSFTNVMTGDITYTSPTLNGQRLFSTTRYDSTSYTVGLKVQPIEQLVIRASYATAFLPPTSEQLVGQPNQDADATQITDPQSKLTYDVPVRSGGNPALKPEHSASWSAGVIWQPDSRLLQGLRVNLEAYRIKQRDKISIVSPQTIVDLESSFPARVQRDADGTITAIDATYINVTEYSTQGMDVSVGYTRRTSLGRFSVDLVTTVIDGDERQLSLTEPVYDYVGYVAEDGAGKKKGNLNLAWERGNFSAAWNTRYFGPYFQYGAPGGPASLRTANGGIADTYVLSQGSDTIPSQIYHDLMIGYSWPKHAASPVAQGAAVPSWLQGTQLQIGVKNIANTAPPFDSYFGNAYLSPYGDVRMRSYWVSLRHSF